MWRRRHLLGGINYEGLTGKGKTEYLKGTGDILVGDFGQHFEEKLYCLEGFWYNSGGKTASVRLCGTECV